MPALTLHRTPLLGVLLVLVAVLLARPAAPAAAEQSPVPGSVSSVTSTTLTIDVPRGVRPTRIEGRLLAVRPLPGTVAVTLDGRAVTRVPARSTDLVVVPFSATTLGADRTVELGLAYEPGPGCTPPAPGSDLTLGSLRLASTGVETTPTSARTFLPASSPRVDVVVPPRAGDPVLAAALAAVAALSSRYDRGTAVVLSPADAVLPRVGVGQRVVRLVPGPGSVTRTVEDRFGLPTLRIGGPGADLLTAARALGEDPSSPRRTAVLQRTLADLDAAPVLDARSRTTEEILVRQDAFGEPVEALDLALRGTHTVLPSGVEAQLNTYVDGTLVDSQLLDDDPALSVDVRVDGSLLGADTRIRLGLTAARADGRCAVALPVEVAVDPSSSITATPGAGDLTGFARFPQVLAGDLPVALAVTGPARVAAAVDAAYVVTALQRAAAAPLLVSLVTPAAMDGGGRGGLLVGGAVDGTLDTGPGPPFGAAGEAGRPYAVLRAELRDEAPWLLLGAGGPGSATTADLTRRVATATAVRGWSAVDGDALVATGRDSPVTLTIGDPPAPAPPASSGPAPTEQASPEVPADGPPASRADADPGRDGSGSQGWWFAAVALLMLVLLAAQAARSVGRRRGTRSEDHTTTPSGDAA